MVPPLVPSSGEPVDDNAKASTSAPRTPKPSCPTALLSKAWTSAPATASATSSRITVGSTISTAADRATSRSHPASNSSSSSTRASTPIPELSIRPSTPQVTSADRLFGTSQLSPHDQAPPITITSGHGSDKSGSDHSSDGAFNDAAQDDAEADAVGFTTSSSIHALDLLHKVNDKAAADRATQSQSLRSRLSQLSVSRGSTKQRSRSNSKDDRQIPTQFREASHAESSTNAVDGSASDGAQEPQLSSHEIQEQRYDAASSTTSPKEAEQFADRKYYILSSAGKPIYISHASPSRRKRRRDRRRRQDSSSPTAEPDHTATDESDEEDESSTTQVGVMQALISIFADEDSDKLRYIRQGDLLITFLLRAPLYLVCISTWNEEPSTLRQHLEYLYLQVISLVSASQLSRLFGRMPNFDLRRLLEGTEGIFDYLVNQLNANEAELDEAEDNAETMEPRTDWASCHQWWLQALQPVRITVPNLRDQLTAALQPPAESSSTSSATQPQRPKDLLYVLLIANGRIVSLLRPRKHAVHPIDLLLLTNTVMGSRSIKRSGGSEEAEIWMPFSIPKFAPQGFVHVYVKFLDPQSWMSTPLESGMTRSELAVIVVTADKDAFPTVSNWISSLIAKPPAAGSSASTAAGKANKSKSAKPAAEGEAWMTAFQTHVLSLCRHLCDPTNAEDGAPRVSAYTCAELSLPGLRHFVYRSNSTIQLTSPSLPSPYSTHPADRKRLFTLYSLLHHHIHHPIPPSPSPSSSSAATESSAPQLASALGFGSWATPTRPLLNADRRLKMQLVKTPHEQVLAWITSPFELYLCVNPQVSKAGIVAIANGLTKWIKANERELFLVNAGSF